MANYLNVSKILIVNMPDDKPKKIIYDEFDRIPDEDFAFLEERGQSDFVKYLKGNRKKTSKALFRFAKDLSNEAKETKEASLLVVKFLKEGKISADEEKELRTQVYDLFKMMGIGIPFVLIPGSTLLLPFLLRISKRFGINLLPTSFTHTEDDSKNE
jgi:hypothetical protein